MTWNRSLNPYHVGHSEEGFSLNWSPLIPGRLVTGDCSKDIYLWHPTQAKTWNVDSTPFRGHQDSVEDLRWSTTEPDVSKNKLVFS